MFLQGILLLLTLPLAEDSVYLYDNDDTQRTEYYDCLCHNNLLYCRRPLPPINLQRDKAPWNFYAGGKHHSFKSFVQNDTKVSTILHQWKSSIEKAEEYSRYTKKSNELINDDKHYLCECKNPASFGKHCEYLLLMGVTFEETLDEQFEMRNYHDCDHEYSWDIQTYGDVVCYTTLDCNSGLLCLDWRDIGDGIQQCMMGYDEENCNKLEFNECVSRRIFSGW